MQSQRNAGEDGQRISNGLSAFHTGNSKELWKDQDGRQKIQAASKGSGKRCHPAFADALKQHVCYHGEGLQHNGEALEAKRHLADSDDLRVVFLEKADHLRCMEKDHKGEQPEDHKACQQCEPVAGTDAPVFFGAVVIGCYRLEALTDTDHDGADKHNNTAGYGHGGNDRIPEGIGGNV